MSTTEMRYPIPSTPTGEHDKFALSGKARSNCISAILQQIHFKDVLQWIVLIFLATAMAWQYTEIQELKHRPSALGDADEMNDAVGNPQMLQSNVGDTSKTRSRREAVTNPRHIDGPGWSVFGNNLNNTQPLIHMTQITSNELKKDQFFTWHSLDQDMEYQDLISQHMVFKRNRFIEIVQPGYYLIYSQITYSDTNDDIVGHEVVKRPSCGKGEDLVLLRSRQSQTGTVNTDFGPEYPRDSGNVLGVFYFSTNDYIGVRPLSDESTRDVYRYANFPGELTTGNYFGAFMIASDPRSRMTEIRECCDNSILMQ